MLKESNEKKQTKKEQKTHQMNKQTIVNDFWVLWKKMLKISFAQNHTKRTICCTIKYHTHTHLQSFLIFNLNLTLHFDAYPFCLLFCLEFYKTIWKIHHR